MNREKLPFRKNCEGYFTDGTGNVLAKKMKVGYLLFPGGGIDLNESVEEGMKRETYEETGAIIKNIKFLETLKFKWGENWAKTDKQKQRYKLFKGEKMFLFMGKIKVFEKPTNEEDSWKGRKLIQIKEAIKFIENKKPFSLDVKKYRESQLTKFD